MRLIIIFGDGVAAKPILFKQALDQWCERCSQQIYGFFSFIEAVVAVIRTLNASERMVKAALGHMPWNTQ